MRILEPSVRLVHATPDPARVVEAMGRTCYQSLHRVRHCEVCCGAGERVTNQPCGACGGTGTDECSAINFVMMILRNGHESVLEHVSAGFKIVTDRGVTHELVRHRIASFSQESTRYCDYTGERFGGELTFVRPPDLGDEAGSHWSASMCWAESQYRNLRDAGAKPEIARSVLPNSLKAEIGMTCNAREWRHFLRLRLSPKAHPQMRQVAEMIRVQLIRWFPAAFEEFAE